MNKLFAIEITKTCESCSLVQSPAVLDSSARLWRNSEYNFGLEQLGHWNFHPVHN